MSRLNWPSLIVVAFCSTAIGIILWDLVRRQLRANHRDEDEHRAEGRPLKQMKPRSWVIVVVTVAVISYLTYGSPRHGGRRPPGSAAAGWLAMALPALILLLIAALYGAIHFHPTNRASRLVGRQRYDQAAALIRARMARRRGGPPAAERGNNPYNPPSIESTPSHQQAEADDWNTLGTIALARRDWAEALACFERSEALGTTNGFIPRSNRGLVLIDTGRVAEGVAVVEQAIAEVAVADSWSRALLGLLLAEHLIEASDRDRARPILAQAAQDRQQARHLTRSARRQFDARLAVAQRRVAEAGESPQAASAPGPAAG